MQRFTPGMATPSSSGSIPAVEIEVDATRKILGIHFHGVVTAEHLKARVGEIRERLTDLGPGFSVVTDLTHLQEMEIDTVRDITGMMDLYLQAGVKQIVRVIPDPDKD